MTEPLERGVEVWGGGGSARVGRPGTRGGGGRVGGGDMGRASMKDDGGGGGDGR